MVDAVKIRAAEPKDAGWIAGMIRDIGAYERLSDEVEATEETIRAALFERHEAEAIIASYHGADVGYVVFCHNFSTFRARHGLYIEDIFVSEHVRGKGVGRALFDAVRAIAKERNCARIEWVCLNWNEPARAFYHKMGAKAVNGWTIHRIDL